MCALLGEGQGGWGPEGGEGEGLSSPAPQDPPKIYIQVLTPVPVSMTSFENNLQMSLVKDLKMRLSWI